MAFAFDQSLRCDAVNKHNILHNSSKRFIKLGFILALCKHDGCTWHTSIDDKNRKTLSKHKHIISNKYLNYLFRQRYLCLSSFLFIINQKPHILFVHYTAQIKIIIRPHIRPIHFFDLCTGHLLLGHDTLNLENCRKSIS